MSFFITTVLLDTDVVWLLPGFVGFFWGLDSSISEKSTFVCTSQVTVPTASADDAQVVTVAGFRAAAEDGLNIKRSADGFVDVISADGFGRFPELNVGEALTRYGCSGATISL